MRDLAQDGEYTGPGDSPPGYAGDYYETNNVGHMDGETGELTPVADCYRSADARLIAAAPDMLAACEFVLDVIDAGRAIPDSPRLPFDRTRAEQMIRAAVAKARGQS
jgi:hypothetical protein